MDFIISEHVSEERLRDALCSRDGHAGRAVLEELARTLAGMIDPEIAAERAACFHESIPAQDRVWVAHGISSMALAEDRTLLAVAAQTADRLELFDCIPALSLAVERFPRKFGAPLRKAICHISKTLQDRVWELPWQERARQEMENIIRRGVFEYAEPVAQVTHAARGLADYLELVQRQGKDFDFCRSWVLENLNGGDPTARLAALQLCGIFQIREAIPAITYLSKLPEFKTPNSLEHRTITTAAGQLRIVLDGE